MLFEDPQITDISYNGRDVFYQHNDYGRRKSDIVITNLEVHDFLRHIANLGEKQFSFSEPLLDMSFGRFRLNAVHYSLGRNNDDKTPTFSIRIASSRVRINEKSDFMPQAIITLFDALIRHMQSIVIGGLTGTGKTELQKFLLSRLPIFSRVVIIDNIQELSYSAINSDVDLTCWQVNNYLPQTSFQELIRNALRSNPDWLIVAESRGKEMIDVLNSAMTGHPVITTIHARSAEAIANRMVRMVLMNGGETTYDEARSDIHEHFRYFAYLKKEIREDGCIHRFLDSFLEFDGAKNEFRIIYRRIGSADCFQEPSEQTRAMLAKDCRMDGWSQQ